MDKSQVLYNKAYSLLGVHCTMDDSIPAVIGCGEAMSYVLNASELVAMPLKGIAGTAAWLDYMRKSPLFVEVETPTVGSIIVSATGTGNGVVRGHIGLVGKFHIMSNNSGNGLWGDQWTLPQWIAHYEVFGGIKTRYFQLNH